MLKKICPGRVVVDIDCVTLEHQQAIAFASKGHEVIGVSGFSDEPSVHCVQFSRMIALPTDKGRLGPFVDALQQTLKAKPGCSVINEPNESLAREKDLRCVVVAASTGGPDALRILFSSLPRDLPSPVFVVQHMPIAFTHYLSDTLARRSRPPVQQARDNEIAKPSTIYIAPAGQHMIVARRKAQIVVHLRQSAPENFVRPSADVLFRSAAQAFGSAVLGVVLSGMGHDGLDGCRHIVAAGGRVIVQDEATSAVWGMLGAVSKAGLAQKVVPISRIAAEVTDYVSVEALATLGQ